MIASASNGMSSDFIFVDPSKIPPRRSVREGGSRNVKIRRIPQTRESFDPEEEHELEIPPEFVLNPGEFQVHFASHGAADNPLPFVSEDSDPITQEIFLAPRNNRPEAVIQHSQAPIFEFKKEEAFAPESKEKIKAVQVSSEITELEDTNSREAILAELERIDSSDAELFKKIKRLNMPRRENRIDLAQSLSESEIKKLPPGIRLRLLKQRMFGNNKEVVFENRGDFSEAEDYARAESDWFQINLSASDRVSRLKDMAENRKEEISAGVTEEDFEKLDYRGSKSPRTFMAVVLMALIPLSASVFLFSNRENFFKSAFGSINSKLLGSSSFVIINSQGSSVFPEVSEAKSKLEGSGVPEEAGIFFDKFFEENSSFNWLNIFKKKAIGQSAKIGGLEFLEKAKELIKSVANPSIDPVKKDLDKEISKFNFWQQFLAEGKQYLVVLVDPEIARPIGGKPVSYALIKSNGEGLETTGSGKFLALDAASDLKKIPPEPVRIYSTAWMPSDSGWFFDFSDSGETFIEFFENATQLKVDGVISISKDFLKEASFKESLIFDIESPNWFYGLVEALERKPSHRWTGIAGELEKAIESHKAQFYFKDSDMNGYAVNSNLLVSSKISDNEDALGIAWATFQGSGMALELVESRNSVDKDGSVSESLNVMAKQGASGLSKNYFKIYIPKGSEILKISGFSQKEKTPEFDYFSKGFLPDSRINPSVTASDESWNADIFEESGLMVIGGWIDAKSQERKKISLEYNLPFKLSRKNDYLIYKMKVFRPLQSEDAPFRFNLLPGDGVEIISLDPNGFVSENLGEYQGTLGSDINLSASLIAD